MRDFRLGAAICCKIPMLVGLLFLGLVAVPGTAMASGPVVTTGAATSIDSGGATLSGIINPEGTPESSFPGSGYHFDYARSGSNFCTGGPISGFGSSPEGGTPATPLGYSDSSDHPVSAVVSGLMPSTSYCFALIYNGSAGSLGTFTTAQPLKLEVHVSGDGSVTSVGGGSALVGIGCSGSHARITPDGQKGKCSSSLVQGMVVTLEERPSMNADESGRFIARFAGWSGACAGSGTESTCTFKMNSDTTVGATFEPLSPSAAAVGRAVAAVLTPSGPAAKIDAILKTGSYPAAFSAPGAGTAQVVWYQGSPGARITAAQKPSFRKSALVASGTKKFTKAGKAMIKVKLTSKGKALLKKVKKGHKLTLTAKGSFTPKGGKKTSKQKSFTLKR